MTQTETAFSRTQLGTLGLYYALLLTTAIIRDVFLIPLATHLGPAGILVEPVWKLLFWLLPTLLIIKYLKQGAILDYLGLTRYIGRGLLYGGGASLVVFVLLFLPSLLLGRSTLHLHQTPDTWLNVVVLVGIFEEVPFRGFLFQYLYKALGSFWRASLLSSAGFVLIHWPLWLLSASTSSPVMLAYESVTIFLLGLAYAAVYFFSRSLWGSILLHSLYNLFVALLS